jgi:hypothetical protein
MTSMGTRRGPRARAARSRQHLTRLVATPRPSSWPARQPSVAVSRAGQQRRLSVADNNPSCRGRYHFGQVCKILASWLG